MIARPAVFDRIDAAGVIRHHPANCCHIGTAAGGWREKQAIGFELVIQIIVDNAGLNRDLKVLCVHGDNTVHMREVRNDPALDRNRVAFQARSRSPRRQRQSLFISIAHGPANVLGRLGPDNHVGERRRTGRLVV